MAENILVALKTIVPGKATVDQLKYWCKLVGIKPKIVGRQGHVTPADAAVLREMARLVEEGQAPSVAAATVGNSLMVKPIHCEVEENHGKLSAIEKALLVVANESVAIRAEIGTLRQENQALRWEIAGLRQESQASRSDVAMIRQLLTPPADQPSQVEPWKPKVRRDPLEGQPWYQRLWVSLVDPASLRAAES